MRAHKNETGHWILTKSDIDAYRANKYNRDEMKHDGKRVFDPEAGTFSVEQVMRIMSEHLGEPYPKQKLYYKLYSGQLKASRSGVAWVIRKEDAIDLLDKELGIKLDPRQLRFA